MLKLERFANHTLMFSALLAVGYFICCLVGISWILWEDRQPLTWGSVIMSARVFVAISWLPIGFAVISVSVVSVLMRNRSWLAHLAGGMVASLSVPIFLNVQFTLIEHKGIMPILFVPAIAMAFAVVWTTRTLYHAMTSPRQPI